jgi:hypothetical protein
MLCPNCKCEYIRGVTECAECGVALVDALDPGASAPPANDEIVSVWQGDDPADCATVTDALKKAGIPVLNQGPTGYFINPSMRPKTEICVSSANAERAGKILADLQSWDDPEEMTEEERASLELPESNLNNNDSQSTLPQDLTQDWYEDDPVAEVWSGDREDFGDGLLACFREVGIASRKFAEAGHWRVVVRPRQEARAKEIVREVVDASPPQ